MTSVVDGGFSFPSMVLNVLNVLFCSVMFLFCSKIPRGGGGGSGFGVFFSGFFFCDSV